jgi:hypothetical protein
MQQTWRAASKIQNNGSGKNKKSTLLIKNYLELI